jgi:hypothetical protein
MNALEIEEDGTVHISFSHAGKTLAGTMSFDTLYTTLARMFDEAALADAEAKVAELRKRLGNRNPVEKVPQLPRVVSQYEGTDAEFGANFEESDGGAAEFRNDLLDMRTRNLSRRRRA